MKKIKLTQGKYALVDDEDFELLNKYKWYAHKNKGGYYYAIRNAKNEITGKRFSIRMHCEIMGRKIIDHIDRDGLNNTRKNLRLSCFKTNSMNRKNRKNSPFGFKGVSRTKNGKFNASIMKDGKRIHLGTRKTAKECAELYNNKAIEIFGEYAYLNKL